VDEPDLGEARLTRGLQLGSHTLPHVPGREGVQVEMLLHGEDHRLVGVVFGHGADGDRISSSAPVLKNLHSS
jgi:hypothetical protein